MRLSRWSFIGISLAGSLLAVLLVGITVLHFNPLCGEEPIYEETSPGGQYVAATMVRNCGATTSYVTHVNLRSSKSSFKSGFLDGTIKAGEVATVGNYDGKVLFCWLSPRQFNIEYPTPDSERLMKHAWQDVTITYGEKCP